MDKPPHPERRKPHETIAENLRHFLMAPQWEKVLFSARRVDSCPPCAVAVLVNDDVGLLTNSPLNQGFREQWNKKHR
jgi:hypothetical protein